MDQFILPQGRPLPQNVGAIWEPYQRSRCVVAGRTWSTLRPSIRPARLIPELLEAHGEQYHSASLTCTRIKRDITDNDGRKWLPGSINQPQKMRAGLRNPKLIALRLPQTMKHESEAKAKVYYVETLP